MKMRTISLATMVCAIVFATACNNAENQENQNNQDQQQQTEAQNANQAAVANITGTYTDTMVSGTVRFEDVPNNQVRMTMDLSVPSKANNTVAVHIHENGDCGDHGKHAGGHWNPTNEPHGEWGSAQHHSGDFGNVQLDAQGRGTLELISDRWSLQDGVNNSVINKTIMVHSGTDDLKSQPSGNSGNRIGCGIITRQGS